MWHDFLAGGKEEKSSKNRRWRQVITCQYFFYGQCQSEGTPKNWAADKNVTIFLWYSNTVPTFDQGKVKALVFLTAKNRLNCLIKITFF